MFSRDDASEESEQLWKKWQEESPRANVHMTLESMECAFASSAGRTDESTKDRGSAETTDEQNCLVISQLFHKTIALIERASAVDCMDETFLNIFPDSSWCRLSIGPQRLSAFFQRRNDLLISIRLLTLLRINLCVHSFQYSPIWDFFKAALSDEGYCQRPLSARKCDGVPAPRQYGTQPEKLAPSRRTLSSREKP